MEKAFKKMTEGEREVFDWTEMVLKETKQRIPSPVQGNNGLIKAMIPVPAAEAERELTASAVKEAIANDNNVLLNGFIKAGKRTIVNATTGQRWEIPVFQNLPETERLPNCLNETEEVLPMVSESPKCQSEVRKAVEPVEEKELTLRISEDEFTIPGTEVVVKLVEKQEHFSRDNSESVFQYVFEVCSLASRKKVRVKGEKLQQLTWLVSATDGLLYLTAKLEEQIKKALILMIQKSRLTVVAYHEVNGWTQTDRGFVYVLSNGIIGDPECGVRGNPRYNFPDIQKVSCRDVFLEVLDMLQICRSKKIMWELILYVQAAFLSTLFDMAGMPLKTILALIGETNSRKTTLAILLGKVFNRLNRIPDVTFTATPGGIEKMIYQFHDSCLILDDMKPGATKEQNRDINQKLEQVTRLYGDRTPKKRMTGYGSDEELRINGGCIVTGEYIEGVESSRARRLEVTIDREEVDNEKLSECQRRDVWPTYLYHFLTFITAKFAETVEYIRSRSEELRRTAGFKLDRRNEIWAQLSVVVEIMMSFGVECGAISQEESCELAMEGRNAIYELLTENEKEAQRVSPVCLVLRALNAYVQENGEPEVMFSGDTKKLYASDEYYFVALPKLIEIALDYTRRTAADTVLPGERMLPKLLEAEEVLETRMEGGQKRRTHHLPGDTTGPRFLWIRKGKLTEYIERNGVQ